MGSALRSVLIHSTKKAPPVIYHLVGDLGVSLVARLVKNPPAMLEALVRLLGWEDPVEKG